MIQPLIGAYNAFATRGWEEYLLMAVRGDDVNAGGDQVPLQDTDNYIYSPDNWMYNSVWNLNYADIVSVNNAADLIGNYKALADPSEHAEQINT